VVRISISSVLVVSFVLFTVSCVNKQTEPSRVDRLAEVARLEDTRDFGAGRLLGLLGDPDAEVRLRTVRALGRIGDDRAVKSVQQLLSDSLTEIRIEAAFALGQIGGSDALLAVIAALKSEKSDEVKSELLAALGRIGDLTAVATIIKYLDNPSPRVRSAGLMAMSRLKGHGQTQKLIRLTRDADDDVRWRALYALARTSDSSARGKLSESLRDRNLLVRQFAARAIGLIGDSAALPSLIQTLDIERDDLVRVNLLRSIASVGDKTSLKTLLNFVSGDFTVHVRSEAVAAIGALKLRTAAQFLRPLMEDKSKEIRCAAISAVAQLDPDFFIESTPRLLQTSDYLTKARVLDGLSTIKTDASFRVIEQALADRDGRVRRSALEAAGMHDRPELTKLIAKALDDPDFTVRLVAAGLIATTHDTSFVDRLVNCFVLPPADKEPDLRIAIVDVLAALADSAAPDSRISGLLDGAIKDPDRHVRSSAATALRKLGTNDPPSVGPFETDLSVVGYAKLYDHFVANPSAIIATNRGEISIELLYDQAPKTVLNFITLSRGGFYNGRTWHRVIPSFVAQGGCPRGDGWGGPGYTIRCEYNRVPFLRGTIGMAHAGKDTGGSQFFIAHTALPHLDGAYTVFGRVVHGMEVVDRIELGDTIRSVEIVSEDE
jgi:cyclophilin family peptidyl-prolyl cis-trans isomerase/HEAT repeat protein